MKYKTKAFVSSLKSINKTNRRERNVELIVKVKWSNKMEFSMTRGLFCSTLVHSFDKQIPRSHCIHNTLGTCTNRDWFHFLLFKNSKWVSQSVCEQHHLWYLESSSYCQWFSQIKEYKKCRMQSIRIQINHRSNDNTAYWYRTLLFKSTLVIVIQIICIIWKEILWRN